MLTMADLPYPPLPEDRGYSDVVEYTLPDDLVLDDSAFSNKKTELARKGEKITLRHYPNYGLVKHPVHGIFRY